MDKEKIFVDGFSVKPLDNEQYPWLKAQIGLNPTKLKVFMDAYTDDRGWVNITLKESKGGTWYAELDTWKPKAKAEETPVEDTTESPF